MVAGVGGEHMKLWGEMKNQIRLKRFASDSSDMIWAKEIYTNRITERINVWLRKALEH